MQDMFRRIRLSLGVLLLLSPPKSTVSGQAIADLQQRAQAGDPAAQFRLGVEYAIGTRIPLDLAQAAHWYVKAGERGHASAQFNLGVAYHNGLGVKKSDAESLRWYRKA